MLTQKKHSVLLLLLLIGLAFGAQTASAKVSVTKPNIGQNFEYQILIFGEPTSYIPPSFEGFNKISGPNTSATYQVKDGVTSNSMRIYWTLSPKKAGKIRIAPATVVFGETRLQTKGFKLKVRNKIDKHIQLN
ncbi:MAG: BatD family protein [Bacteroidota bacterium]